MKFSLTGTLVGKEKKTVERDGKQYVNCSICVSDGTSVETFRISDTLYSVVEKKKLYEPIDLIVEPHIYLNPEYRSYIAVVSVK